MEEIQNTPPANAAGPAEAPRPVSGDGTTPQDAQKQKRRQVLGLTLIVLVILLVVGLSTYGMVTHPTFTSVLRDISIIVLALVTIIIGLFLIVLIFQLQSLIALLRDEVKPILESANQTANTVRGTTTFMSDAVITPLITVVSYASAVRQTTSLLFGGSRRKRPGPPPPAPPATGPEQP